VLAVLQYCYSKIRETLGEMNKNNALGIKVKTLKGSKVQIQKFKKHAKSVNIDGRAILKCFLKV